MAGFMPDLLHFNDLWKGSLTKTGDYYFFIFICIKCNIRLWVQQKKMWNMEWKLLMIRFWNAIDKFSFINFLYFKIFIL